MKVGEAIACFGLAGVTGVTFVGEGGGVGAVAFQLGCHGDVQ